MKVYFGYKILLLIKLMWILILEAGRHEFYQIYNEMIIMHYKWILHIVETNF